MQRIFHANRALDGPYPALSESFTVGGAAVVCDPLGGLYLPENDALVVSDLHLEKGAAFARRGMMLPPYDTLATLKILKEVVSRHDPKTVICLGDNFHDRAGSVLMPEIFRQMIIEMATGREWIWINGNHDPEGVDNLPGLSLDELLFGGLTFRHEPRPLPAPGEIAGHLHPAAVVHRRGRSVRRACFATDGDRLVMPAFGVTTGGLDIAHPDAVRFFDTRRLVAHMLGRDRIYSVRFANLRG